MKKSRDPAQGFSNREKSGFETRSIPEYRLVASLFLLQLHRKEMKDVTERQFRIPVRQTAIEQTLIKLNVISFHGTDFMQDAFRKYRTEALAEKNIPFHANRQKFLDANPYFETALLNIEK